MTIRAGSDPIAFPRFRASSPSRCEDIARKKMGATICLSQRLAAGAEARRLPG